MNAEEYHRKILKEEGLKGNLVEMTVAKSFLSHCFAESYAAMKLEEYKKENELSKSKIGSSLDLRELERKLNEALEKETPESFQEWYDKQVK